MKWSLHAQEKIVFELLQQLRGNAARVLLEGVMKSTRQMFAEQEAVQSRLFIIQDVMQNSVQAWLQVLQNPNYFFKKKNKYIQRRGTLMVFQQTALES